MFKYAFKRVIRSYRLFVALTLGVLVATTFFASTNVAADILARNALDSSLEGVVYEFDVDSLMSDWSQYNLNSIESEISQIPEITNYTRVSTMGYDYNNTGHTSFQIFGIEWNSQFTRGLSVIAGNETLGANETYIVSGSRNESLFSIGDVIPLDVSVEIPNPPYFTEFQWNFTVAGFVSIPIESREALQQNQFAGVLRGAFGLNIESPYNMMLTNWDLSSIPIIEYADTFVDRGSYSMRISYRLNIDRTSILDPYDIQGSQEDIQNIQNRIESRLERFNVHVVSTLQFPLMAYMLISLMMNFTFISLSLPIFFMAYFTGTMVSDVSYNLRRREIGLLLTKGHKQKTIRNMLLMEGLIVGGIAGAASVFLGSFISWTVLQVPGLSFFTVMSNNSSAITLSVILGMFLALISVWRPANRASKLEILDALKQYVYVEETAEYKRLLPTISFILGTYKLALWILGISANQLVDLLNIGGNITIAIGVGALIALDAILNYIGPLLFLYGTTKLFLRGSQRFQEIVVNAGSRFFGAFGKLATRNVKRNPARNAAMVFLISLIVSYGVFAVGSLYSENNVVERNALYDVGADVRINLQSSANLTQVLDIVNANQDVISTTTEYRLSLRTGSTSISTRGINPDTWLDTAFWEPSWFIGDVNQMMDGLKDDGIILSLSIANELGVSVGDNLSVRSSLFSDPHDVEIVGLIGYQSLLESFMIGMSGPGGPQDLQLSIGGNYPSFVSVDFLNSSNFINSASKHILIDTAQGVNGTALQEEFHEEISSLQSSASFTSEMADYWARPIDSGITKIRWVAIAFSVILAFVGTTLVIVLTIREKEAEIALLTVRGFTKWQLFKTLLAEMMVMVVFSLLLGSFVGFVEIFGNVSQLNDSVTGLIRYNVIIFGTAGLTMLGIIGVVIFAAAFPVWLASRRPESKVDVLRA